MIFCQASIQVSRFLECPKLLNRAMAEILARIPAHRAAAGGGCMHQFTQLSAFLGHVTPPVPAAILFDTGSVMPTLSALKRIFHHQSSSRTGPPAAQGILC